MEKWGDQVDKYCRVKKRSKRGKKGGGLRREKKRERKHGIDVSFSIWDRGRNILLGVYSILFLFWLSLREWFIRARYLVMKYFTVNCLLFLMHGPYHDMHVHNDSG